MDNKQLTQRLAKTSSLEYRETADMMQSVVAVITDLLCDGDSVAIPGFGVFSTLKEDEQIIRDLSTGHRLLLPPSVTACFTPGTQLKKSLS